MDIVIRNGTLVTPGAIFPTDVGIIGERIAVLLQQAQDTAGEELHGAVELDATDCYVLPGAVAPHVHLQMPTGDAHPGLAP